MLYTLPSFHGYQEAEDGFGRRHESGQVGQSGLSIPVQMAVRASIHGKLRSRE